MLFAAGIAIGLVLGAALLALLLKSRTAQASARLRAGATS